MGMLKRTPRAQSLRAGISKKWSGHRKASAQPRKHKSEEEDLTKGIKLCWLYTSKRMIFWNILVTQKLNAKIIQLIIEKWIEYRSQKNQGNDP